MKETKESIKKRILLALFESLYERNIRLVGKERIKYKYLTFAQIVRIIFGEKVGLNKKREIKRYLIELVDEGYIKYIWSEPPFYILITL